jgi:DNA polymerase-1
MDVTKKRLLLVDASSYLYRAFHALPEFRSPAGEPTGAILGVINMLRKLKQDFPSDYIACVLDPKGRTFRDDIYPEYKASRSRHRSSRCTRPSRRWAGPSSWSRAWRRTT